MSRLFLRCLVACLLGAVIRADAAEGSSQQVVLGANEYLASGADAIRAGRYDEGIRLTLIGLERRTAGIHNRAAGLANLCAAYVSKNEPDAAIPYCNEAIGLEGNNWRVYSVRSQAYFQKGMYRQAARDNDAAAAINPDAPHVRMIRGLLNEALLVPRVTIEDFP